ncbi:MAG: hypothetical protein ACI849_001591 [Patiriisocius sp.]|jgi:hypothetical protein
MKQKKNIDQLFKERFAEHEVTPPAHVWENIQAQLLEKKKDRVIIPLWWKVAGVAAAFVLLFTLGNMFNKSNNSIVEETPSLEEGIERTPEIKKDLEVNTNENAIQVAETNEVEILDDEDSLENHTLSKNSNNTTENSVNNSKTGLASTVKKNKQKNTVTTQAIAIVDPAIISEDLPPSTSAVAQNNTENKDAFVAPINSTETARKDALAKNKNKTNTEATTNPQLKEDPIITPRTEDAVVIEEVPLKETKAKKSIFDAIEEQKQIEAKEALAEKNTPQDRWEIAPNIAPVYYNSLNEGSSIDPSFSDNSQSGDVNISYGIGVRYALSDRLKIRSGISNVDLSYSTGGLELGDGPISAALQGVNYDNAESIIVAQDQGTFAMQADGTFGDITPKSTTGEAFINQNISYYEVPLELSYTLLNNTFGIDVIGGVSTLILGDNEVSVTAGDFNETLGSANNLSGVSFATNVGLGFHYKISRKFKFNVEPMFKYQLNPYTDSSVEFQPYYVGVYTGLSFKF